MSKLRGITNDAERAAFELKCIDEGWVEPKQRGGRPKDADPFDMLLREVRGEFQVDITAAIERDKAEQEAAKAKEKATTKTPKTGRKAD